MAAGLGSKNIFTSPYDNTRKLDAYYLKMSWAEGSSSDPLTILNAYQYWKTRFGSNEFSRKERKEEIEWARKNNIQLKAMKVQVG
jgi:ATP-dependent RNA helicase TDRD9